MLPPAVACTWVAWLAASYHLYVTGAEYFALGLSVWLIYTIDGLLDARKRAPGDPGSPRRDFHADHAGWFWFGLFVGFGILLGHALSAIGSGLFLSGLLLAAMILLYLVYAQKLRRASRALIPKEVFGGVLFATGVGLVVMEAHGRGAVGPVSMELAGQALGRGLFTGMLWLLGSLVFVIRAIFSDPAIPLLAMLFVANCLLTAKLESRDIGDSSSAKRLSPALVALAPVLAAALAFSSGINFFLVSTAELKPVHAAISLCATLLLVINHLSRQGRLSCALATFLLDAALLAPLVLFPWNPPV